MYDLYELFDLALNDRHHDITHLPGKAEVRYQNVNTQIYLGNTCMPDICERCANIDLRSTFVAYYFVSLAHLIDIPDM